MVTSSGFFCASGSFSSERPLLSGSVSFVSGAAAADGEYVSEEFPVSFEVQVLFDETCSPLPSNLRPSVRGIKGYTYKSWICYKKGAVKKPVVLVFPNYAGLKQFDKDQAMFIAKLGYVGLAVDLYKEEEDYMYEDRNPKPNYKDIDMMAGAWFCSFCH